MELSELLKELREETLHPFPAPESPEPESLREKIERLLADGPKSYTEVLAACGGDEDQIRDVLRDMPEIVAFDDGGVWMWGLSHDPASLAEKVAIKYENESPTNLGSPVFWHKGTALAYENDTPVTKVYSWCLVSLFPGRPLSVDPESTARLLELSPQAVREALQRLTKDGDLVRSWEGRREWYRLNVRYPVNGGKDETGD